MKNAESIKYIGKNIKKMSFIIGAGFSKNISNSYLSWWELLQDMIHEMYSSEILYHHFTTDDLIQRYGYLGIASEYIRRKGYHEAIDQYIEKRTPILEPKIDKNKTVYNLTLNGNTVETNVDVSLHRTLLEFGARSIFTFNYDNALDTYDDLVYALEDKERINQTEAALVTTKEIVEEHAVFCANISSALKNINSENLYTPEQTGFSKYTQLTCDYNKFIDRHADYNFDKIAQPETSKDILSKNKNKLEERLDRYTSDIQKWYNERYNRYLLVRKSTDISINETEKKIYKLHGCIRKPGDADKSNRVYGFDYDNHTQYIIAQEDYDTYNNKHEAFVDLMRISLLKDPFCIIGFSCDDPNFLLWINWVKDIQDNLGKNAKDNSNKFYINVSDKRLSDDKILLLQNHYIEVVDLFDCYKDIKGPKEKLKCFFNSIKEIQALSITYDRLWRNITIPDPNNHDNIENIKFDHDVLNDAWNDIINNSVSYIAKADSYYRFDFLNKVLSLRRANLMTDDLYKIFYIAANRENVPFFAYIDKQMTIENFIAPIQDVPLKILFKKAAAVYQIMSEGTTSISRDEFDDDTKCHLDMLIHAYNFDEEKMIDDINQCEPQNSIQKIIKIRHLSNFSSKEIEEISNSDFFANVQEEYFGLQLLTDSSFLFIGKLLNSEILSFLSKFSSRKKKLEENFHDLISFHQLQQDIIKDLNPKGEVRPLGYVNKSPSFSSYDKSFVAATKMLSLFVKSGLQPVMNNITYVSPEDWYKVVEKIYVSYPYACLYYTTLYNDKNLSIRVAQLYSYSNSNNVKMMVTDIFPKILRACKYIKNYMRLDTLFIFASIFVKYVDPKVWKDEFKALFKQYDWQKNENNTFNDSQYEFAEVALKYLHEPNYKHNIIINVLRKGNDITTWDNILVINSAQDIKTLTKEEEDQLKKIMKSTVSVYQSYVVFNLSKFISRKDLIKWAASVPDEFIKDSPLIEALAYNTKKASTLKKRLCSLIVNSTFLWNTGINSDASEIKSVPPSTILNLNKIENDVRLDKQSLELIYVKMRNELSKIEAISKEENHDGIFFKWSPILVDMLCFMLRHEAELNHNSEFYKDIDKCKQLYENTSGFKSPLYKLASNEDYKIREGVLEVYYLSLSLGCNKFSAEYHMMLNHLIQKDTNCIELILYAVNSIALRFPTFFKKGDIPQLLQAIVDVYRDEEVRDQWDVPAKKKEVIAEVYKLEKILSENVSISK